MGPLGVPELIMIFLIALLVFGPKKLPELGKSLGKGLREFKRATDDLKSTWDEQLKEVEKSVDEVKTSVTQHLPSEHDLKAEFYATHTPEPVHEVHATEVTDVKHDEPKKEHSDEVHQA